MELLDLYFKSNNPNDMVVEAFNSFNTFAQVKDYPYQDPANPNPAYTPFPIWLPPSGTTQAKASNMAWETGGQLMISFDNGTPCVEIESIQYPYRSLLEALKVYKIKIHKIRMSCTNQLQLVEPVTQFVRKPLTAKANETTYTITIPPDNVIPSLNDWNQELYIDGSTGLRFKLLGNSVLSWNIHFDFI
jgi:hypothetical protein